MGHSLGRHAIVIGAGMGGLTAATALSNHFERVTILDRDTLPDEPKPRIGTPQARQVHLLLGGGQEAIKSFFPDFEDRLEAAGAVRVRTGLDIRFERKDIDSFPQRDLGWDTFCMSRPLLEFVTRGCVAGLPNVAIKSRCRVTEVEAAADGKSAAGVRYGDADGKSQTLASEFVVDASSRALTLAFLEKTGFVKPEEIEIGVDLAYATATFPMRADPTRGWKGLIHGSSAPQSGRAAIIIPIERDRWHLTLAGVHGDAPPADVEGFISFAKSLRTPTIYNAIEGTAPLGPIERFAFPSSLRRHFERLQSFPAGLIPFSDAICKFNPAFGQGMSVASQEACALGRLLTGRVGRANPLDGLAQAFFAEIEGVLASPWSVAETDFIFPQTRGERPADFQQRMIYSDALWRIAAEDVDVQKTMAEVGHLMKSPTALREPELMRRVIARLASRSP